MVNANFPNAWDTDAVQIEIERTVAETRDLEAERGIVPWLLAVSATAALAFVIAL